MVANGYHWSIKKSQKSWEFFFPESVTLWNVILKQTVKFFVKHSLYYCSSILFASTSGQSFIERDGIQVNCIIYSSSVHLNLEWKQETLLRATTTTTSFICITIQAHTVLQKLCLGIKITTRQIGYFDNNLSARTSKQAEIYFMNCILIKFIRRVHQFIDQTVEWSSNTAANSWGCLPSVVIIASCVFALTVLAYTCLKFFQLQQETKQCYIGYEPKW